MALIIKADGTSERVEVPTDTDARTDLFQKAVGGYFQQVGADVFGNVVLGNEEGRLRRLPINIALSAMFGYPIVGDCIILTPEEVALDAEPCDCPDCRKALN